MSWPCSIIISEARRTREKERRVSQMYFENLFNIHALGLNDNMSAEDKLTTCHRWLSDHLGLWETSDVALEGNDCPLFVEWKEAYKTCWEVMNNLAA